jgi:hypothetical protein
MSEPDRLAPAELEILLAALDGPRRDPDPERRALQRRLCERQLLERNGEAFGLTRYGWEQIKAERRGGSHRHG